jgi:hypothetical protein
MTPARCQGVLRQQASSGAAIYRLQLTEMAQYPTDADGP